MVILPLIRAAPGPASRQFRTVLWNLFLNFDMSVGAERNRVCERGHILAWAAHHTSLPNEKPGLFNTRTGGVAPRDRAKLALPPKPTAIRPVMITGDHPLTAQHVASLIGIAGDASS
jgi:hypothetical protein